MKNLYILQFIQSVQLNNFQYSHKVMQPSQPLNSITFLSPHKEATYPLELLSIAPQCHEPQATASLLYLWTSLLRAFHMCGIMQYVIFVTGLLCLACRFLFHPLCTMYQYFIPFFFIDCFFIQTCHILFTHSGPDRQLGCFHFLGIANDAAVNIYV